MFRLFPISETLNKPVITLNSIFFMKMKVLMNESIILIKFKFIFRNGIYHRVYLSGRWSWLITNIVTYKGIKVFFLKLRVIKESNGLDESSKSVTFLISLYEIKNKMYFMNLIFRFRYNIVYYMISSRLIYE